jgi:hypothetical protein
MLFDGIIGLRVPQPTDIAVFLAEARSKFAEPAARYPVI